MTLVPYRPYNLLNDIEKDYGRLFSEFFNNTAGKSLTRGEQDSWSPAVDIHEEDGAYVVHADIPGVDSKDIEVTVDNNVLSIRGERKSDNTYEENGIRRVERFQGTFYRQFALPKSVDTDQIQAKGKNGVLTITIPKSEEVKSKRITVN